MQTSLVHWRKWPEERPRGGRQRCLVVETDGQVIIADFRPEYDQRFTRWTGDIGVTLDLPPGTKFCPLHSLLDLPSDPLVAVREAHRELVVPLREWFSQIHNSKDTAEMLLRLWPSFQVWEDRHADLISLTEGETKREDGGQ